MSKETGSPLTAVFKTVARCEINLGARCTIKHPGHTNSQEYKEFNACNGQEATIVGFYPSGAEEPTSVNLKIETGPNAGELVVDVNPEYLYFQGTFKGKKDAPSVYD